MTQKYTFQLTLKTENLKINPRKIRTHKKLISREQQNKTALVPKPSKRLIPQIKLISGASFADSFLYIGKLIK